MLRSIYKWWVKNRILKKLTMRPTPRVTTVRDSKSYPYPTVLGVVDFYLDGILVGEGTHSPRWSAKSYSFSKLAEDRLAEIIDVKTCKVSELSTYLIGNDKALRELAMLRLKEEI